MRHPGLRLGLVSLSLAVVTLVAAVRALALVIYMAVAYRFDVDPISQPLSMYVFVKGGDQTFDSAALALAAAMITLLFGMRWAGVPLAGKPAVYLSAWAGCLVVATVFPTDRAPYVETATGWVHQTAGAGILALLAMGGWALLPRLRATPDWRPTAGVVRALTAGTAGLAVAYVVSRLGDWFPDLVDVTLGIDPGGLLQRLALSVDAGVIGALAVHLIRLTWPAMRHHDGRHGSETDWDTDWDTDSGSDSPATPQT
jgi:Protein of unknown function (DUF998)